MFSQNTQEKKHLPYHFRMKCILLIMTGDKRCFSCRYGILDHFVSETTFCLFVNFDLRFLWFLIDSEGRYQSKKMRELNKVQKQNKKQNRNGENALTAFCIVAYDIQVLLNKPSDLALHDLQ